VGFNRREEVLLNQYEIAVLFHPDLENDLDKGGKKVEKLITDNGGKVIGQDNWGKRKLAYQIAKLDQAVYVIYSVELPGESVKKMETTLNITDEVIRFLITRPDLKAIGKAEAARKDKAKKAAERGDRDDRDDREDREDREEK
jgi:small subunit ribosomal protein S6